MLRKALLLTAAGKSSFNKAPVAVFIYLFARTWYNINNNYYNSYMSRTTRLSSTSPTAARFSHILLHFKNILKSTVLTDRLKADKL